MFQLLFNLKKATFCVITFGYFIKDINPDLVVSWATKNDVTIIGKALAVVVGSLRDGYFSAIVGFTKVCDLLFTASKCTIISKDLGSKCDTIGAVTL